MAFLADDDVIVDFDPERAGDIDDRLRHLNVGARRRRIARRMIRSQRYRPKIPCSMLAPAVANSTKSLYMPQSPAVHSHAQA